jgi:hypothetical protein
MDIEFITSVCDSIDEYIDIDDVIKFIENAFNQDNNLVIDKNYVITIANKFSNGTKNRCVECGVDMGYCNPRQLCSKTYCSG